MKQIDLASPPPTSDLFKKLQSLARQALKSSRSRAQDTLVRLFSSGLNNHYVLLRNLTLPDEGPKSPGFQIPCVLVGPACLLVINPNDQRGFFRAREVDWLEMEKNTQDYRTAARNPIQETLEMTGRMNRAMRAGGLPYPEIQPVLFFSNAGMHVEIIRPAVRILKVDTTERFLNSLRRVDALLDARQVQALVDYLTELHRTSQAQKKQAEKTQIPFDRQAADRSLKAVETFVERQHLTRKQWLLLGLLLTGTILTLVALVVVALFLI